MRTFPQRSGNSHSVWASRAPMGFAAGIPVGFRGGDAKRETGGPMRLVTLRTAEGTRAGRVEGDEVVGLDWPDVGAVLAANPDLAPVAGLDGPRHPLDGAGLAPLVPRPSKIICLGLNYDSHIKEMGRGMPRAQ